MKKRSEILFYTSIGAGMALGTSSFLMLSGLFEIVSGLWVALSIILAGGFCMLIASSVGELASMYPSSPGIRTYLKHAFGNKTSLFLVHVYLIFIIIIAGVESYLFGQVVNAIFPNVSTLLVVLVMLMLVIGINLMGLELPRWAQVLSAGILISCILVFGIIGILNHSDSLEGALHLSAGINNENLFLLPAATAMAIFLFIGFEWVTPLGLRPESYRRIIPYCMLAAILINVIAYASFVTGMASQLEVDAIVASSVPQIPYSIKLFGDIGIYFAGGLATLAIFSTFNAGILGASRLIFTLTRERCLPKWCAKISYSTGAPIGAISLLGGLSILSSIIVLSFKLELIAAVVGSSLICVIYSCFVLAVIALRRKVPDQKRDFRSKVPVIVKWIIIIMLPIMGLLSLVSLPEAKLQPLFAVVFIVLFALILTRYSYHLSQNK